MNLFLHGIKTSTSRTATRSPEPAFLDAKGRLRTFDVVLANPPYSIKAWNRAALASDPYGRNMWGVPPQGRADYAFFQHIAKSLDPKTGRCAILFPHGVLFRDEEARCARRIVEVRPGRVRPRPGPRLFYNSPMPARRHVLRREKPTERQGKVLFIDAVTEFSREQSQSFLRSSTKQESSRPIAPSSTEKASRPSRRSTRSEQNAYSLAIPLYVASPGYPPTRRQISVIEALADWRMRGNLDAAIRDVIALLRGEVSA